MTLAKDIEKMGKHCKWVELHLRADAEKLCRGCPHNVLCNAIGRNSPSKMDLDFLHTNYSQKLENTPEREIIADLREDCVSASELLLKQEKQLEKYNKIVNVMDVDMSAEALVITIKGILGV